MTEPNVYWIRARSWHIANTLSSGVNGTYTLCGRLLTGPVQEERVYAERTCESCLRRHAEHRDPVRDDGPGN